MNPLPYLIGVPWLAFILVRGIVRAWWRERRNG